MDEYAWALLILGHSLLAQRVEDILAWVSAIGNVALAARGPLTVPSLCAAALDRRIERIYLAGHLQSWRALVETEDYSHPFANFLPGILRYTDLPQIAATLAPRPLTLAGVVDGANRSVITDKVRAVYWADNITIRDSAAWDAESLSRFCH